MRAFLNTSVLALLYVFAPPLLPAEELWVFLKDGRVGRAEAAQVQGGEDEITLKVALNSSGQPVNLKANRAEITNKLTRTEAAQRVDLLIGEMTKGVKVVEHAEEFKRLKDAAAERLCFYLEQQQGKGPVTARLSALYAAQFGWSPELEPLVVAQLRDTDKAVRRTAYTALCLHLPKSRLYEIMKPFADDPDPEFAALIFELIEHYDPNPARMLRMLKNPAAGLVAGAAITRYFDAQLLPAVLNLLERGKPLEQRSALLGLITQEAAPESAGVRKAVAAKLTASAPELRELAAEYFAWNGTPADLAALASALELEKDPWTKAGLEAARKEIEYRAKIQASWPSPEARITATNVSTTVVPAVDYAALASAYEATPTSESYQAALKALQTGATFEPRFVYALDDPRMAQERLRFEARNRLRQFVHAVPYVLEKTEGEFTGEKAAPTTAQFSAPIRGYFDPKRNSYGLRIHAGYGPFSGSIHAGDDHGWLREHTPVVAIAAGLVRKVEYIPSWGHLVVVEHQFPGGEKCCSLYGHLSPLIHVQPGEIVQPGQKIGAIGRNQTCENGGYSAHLHFGIHTGVFGDGHWICGYLSPENFAASQQGWQNPQEFLKNHRAVDVPTNFYQPVIFEAK